MCILCFLFPSFLTVLQFVFFLCPYHVSFLWKHPDPSTYSIMETNPQNMSLCSILQLHVLSLNVHLYHSTLLIPNLSPVSPLLATQCISHLLSVQNLKHFIPMSLFSFPTGLPFCHSNCLNFAIIYNQASAKVEYLPQLPLHSITQLS